MPFPSLTTLALSALLAACTPSSNPPTDTLVASVSTERTYRFDQPIARFELPSALREISGLTVLDDEHLGAIQDEQGNLYVLSTRTGRVTTVIPFGPPGDYEGIERAGDRLFVLRADGALLELASWNDPDAPDARPLPTGLESLKCDAEGLGVTADQRRLLIACKEEGDDEWKGRNVVYAYDLDTNRLDPTPAFVVDPDDVPGKKQLRPSAVAVHPITGETVFISSRRNRLVALDASGTVSRTWSLSDADLEQPEGLAFLPNGDVLIASEGDDGPPILVRFAYE